MERSRLYKNRDKSSEELRRRRADQSVELRKAKKDEQLQKRRNILTPELDETTPLREKQVDTSKLGSYDDVIRDMRSDDESVKTKAVRLCRKSLSVTKDPPIDEFCKRGVISILIPMLSSTHDDLVFEAAWALTNIASGDSRHTHSVVDSGAVPELIRLLGHPASCIAEQSVWALGNIAGDGAVLRDLTIKCGVLDPVIKLLDRTWNLPGVVSNITWMLSNLCRYRNPPPAREVLKTLLPVFTRLLHYEGNNDVIGDSAWALSYSSDAVNDFIDDIIESGCVPRLLRLLASASVKIVSPSLRTIGNLVAGSDAQTQAVLDAGLLDYIPALLNNEKSTVVKEACWLVSNVTAGNVHQVDLVIKHGVLPCILEIFHKGEYKAQKEACWVISNIITGGTTEQCAYLLNLPIFKALKNLLSVSDVKVILMTLEIITKLLEGEPVSCVAVEDCTLCLRNAMIGPMCS
uniref:Importin subunit alpha n=1 Tax=Trichobilharzia regenti TaxID=157069 RepID=A0AA85K9J6_TRIRE|nr:unnamed protein product [Trichobilharzia regenti]